MLDFLIWVQDWKWLLLFVFIFAAFVSVAKFAPNIVWQAEWQAFWASILGMIILPLIPLGLEYGVSSSLSLTTATISAAMFAGTKGIESKNDFVNVSCLIIAILMSASFGMALKGFAVAHIGVPLVCISFVSVAHLLERYSRHIVQKQPFRS